MAKHPSGGGHQNQSANSAIDFSVIYFWPVQMHCCSFIWLSRVHRISATHLQIEFSHRLLRNTGRLAAARRHRRGSPSVDEPNFGPIQRTITNMDIHRAQSRVAAVCTKETTSIVGNSNADNEPRPPETQTSPSRGHRQERLQVGHVIIDQCCAGGHSSVAPPPPSARNSTLYKSKFASFL
jgi:hypothetical protein